VLLAQGIGKGFENAMQPLLIVSLPDEGLQFEAQGLPLLIVERFIDLGDPLVFQREGIDVLIEYVAVLHGGVRRECQQVIGTAR